MATFQEAIVWLKEGKKVRRKSIRGYIIHQKGEDKLRGQTKSGEECPLHLYVGDFEATDWEIYCVKHNWIFEHVEGDSCGHNEYACKQLRRHMGRCKNCGIEKPKESLSDKIHSLIVSWDLKTVEKMQMEEQLFNLNREKIQDIQKRFKEELEMVQKYKWHPTHIIQEIKKIFEEEFGKDLL